MSDKKQIDRVFQEKFKDFEVSPDPKNWEAIKSRLEKKKDDDKVIPIWWRYAGIAALLLLLLNVGGLVFNNGKDANPSIQVVDSENNVPIDSNKENTSNGSEIPLDDNINTKENILSSQGQTDQEKNLENVITNTFGKTNNSINGNSITQNQDVLGSTSSSKNTSVAETSNTIQNTKSSEALNSYNETPHNTYKSSSNNNQENLKEAQVPNNTLTNANKNKVELESEIDGNALKDNTNLNNAILDAVTANEIKEKATIENTITKDSLTIEEAIAKIEDIIEEEKPLNRWSISPSVAPVYFNTLGKGSSIDAQFIDNSKSGEINMSYGITGSYAINKKLVVRAGINKLNLGYNTNEILILETIGKGPNSSLLSNVASPISEEELTVVNARALVIDNNSTIINTSKIGLLNQQIGYIEVPIELQYSLLDKRFGVHVIGGFSSFFLNENKLNSEIGGNSTFLGEATNVNDVSYSANLGLGLNYAIAKHFNFNLEPIFKYQINTFNNTSGDFKPYFVGFYTGFSFKF